MWQCQPGKLGWFLFFGFFQLFQIGDQNEADNDKERPGRYFMEGNKCPGRQLVRVFPGAEVGRNVFRHPNEECHKTEGDDKGHAPFFRNDSEVGSCFPEHNNHNSGEEPTEVGDKVVGEEVEVGENGDRHRIAVRREMFHVYLHEFPGL